MSDRAHPDVCSRLSTASMSSEMSVSTVASQKPLLSDNGDRSSVVIESSRVGRLIGPRCRRYGYPACAAVALIFALVLFGLVFKLFFEHHAGVRRDDQLRAAVDNATGRQASIDDDHAALVARLNAQSVQLADAVRRLDEATTNNRQLRVEFERLNDSHTALSDTFTESHDALNATLHAVEIRLELAEREKQQIRQELLAKSDEIAKLRSDLDRTNASAARCAADLETLTDELRATRNEVGEVGGRVAAVGTAVQTLNSTFWRAREDWSRLREDGEDTRRRLTVVETEQRNVKQSSASTAVQHVAKRNAASSLRVSGGGTTQLFALVVSVLVAVANRWIGSANFNVNLHFHEAH